MKDATSVLEAELDYAIRMVRKGFATPEQAARVCGVRLKDVKERLARPPEPGESGHAYGSPLQR
jgi:hypothetical protein